MSWIEDMQKAIAYIEANICENITAMDIANHILSSGDYFQKMFLIAIGLTVSEYIRNRKLSLAGRELMYAKNKVIDVALRYGYETPASFTKAYKRFHGFTPSRTRVFRDRLKYFHPLTIEITIKGGFNMSETYSWWDENNMEVNMHNNTPLDNGGWDIHDPTSEQIEEAIDRLGVREGAPDFDFLIMSTKNPPFAGMCMQTGTEKGSGDYVVETLTYYDFEDHFETHIHAIHFTDVNEVKKIFTAFAKGIAPETEDWKHTFESFPKKNA